MARPYHYDPGHAADIATALLAHEGSPILIQALVGRLRDRRHPTGTVRGSAAGLRRGGPVRLPVVPASRGDAQRPE